VLLTSQFAFPSLCISVALSIILRYLITGAVFGSKTDEEDPSLLPPSTAPLRLEERAEA
jgi:hypothetical protein